MLTLKKQLFFRSKLNATINKMRSLISYSSKSFSTGHKYLILTNTPDYWNEYFIKENLLKFAELDYIKKINTGINFDLSKNQEATFVVKFKKYNDKELVNELSKMISNYKEIKLELCNELKINHVNLTQSIDCKNLVLVYSKNFNTQLSDIKELEKFIIDNKDNIRIKNSSEDNYMYIWFKEDKYKVELYSLINSLEDKLFCCESKSHYPLLPDTSNNGINFTSSEKEDMKLLKDINNKIEVLNCSEKTPKNKALKEKLLNKRKTLMGVLKEKEALPYIKPYTVVGSSGILVYNF